MKKPTFTEQQKGFIQGYTCAVANAIRFYNEAGTEAVELWMANKHTMAQLKAAGCDEYDLQLLKKHWKELNR